MSMSDPIADLLTRIRNAVMAKHRYVDVPISKMNKAISESFNELGFIKHMLINDEQKKIRLFLVYTEDRSPLINGLKRLSKPGVRKYVNVNQIPTIMKGLGMTILSTSKGVISGRKARHENVGGELLCSIW